MALRRGTRWMTVIALCGLTTGCYEGPEDVDGQPWVGNGQPGADEDPEDSTSETSDGESSGEADDGWPGGDDGEWPDDSNGDSAGDDSGASGGDPDDGPGDSGGPEGPGDAPPPSDEVPDNSYCTDVAGWADAHTQLENEVLAIVNQRRAEGANCGSAGSFGPAGALTMNPALRCAARVHSKDMVDRNFFNHTNPSGEDPFQRMQWAGYTYSTAGENIAAGNSTAAATVQQWMDSDGHCGNIMSPAFTELGVGYYPGGQYGHVWTQAFGAP